MNFKYEPDRHVRDEQEQEQAPVRALPRRGSQRSSDQARCRRSGAGQVEEQERRWHRAEPARVRAAGDPGGRAPLASSMRG